MSINRRSTQTGVRYDVRLRDPGGKPYKRSFRTKREAEEFAARERADRSRGAWIDPRRSSVTFGAWARDWLDSNPAKRPKSRAADEQALWNHVLPALEDRPLGLVTPLDVQRLVSGWAGRFAPSTVRRYYAVLRAIFNSAVDAELVARSPCRRVNLPTIEAGQRHVITPDELAQLANAVGIRFQALVYVGAVLGLRFSECAGLRVGRLDLLRGTLTVAEAAVEVGGRLTFSPPKSRAGRRTMSLPAPLIAMLADHLARSGLSAADGEAFVFTDSRGGPLRYGNFRSRIWQPATRAVGLDALGFHDLRRAAATAMVSQGVDLRTAQSRLGHSDPRLTLAVYAQVTDAGDRAAAEVLGDHFMARIPDEMCHERAMGGARHSSARPRNGR